MRREKRRDDDRQSGCDWSIDWLIDVDEIWLTRAGAYGRGLEAGQLGEREVEVLADRLVLLLLSEQLVCTRHTTTPINHSITDQSGILPWFKY